MINIIKKIFGDKHEKDLKVLWPIVEEINSLETKTKKLKDTDFSKKTKDLKKSKCTACA